MSPQKAEKSFGEKVKQLQSELRPTREVKIAAQLMMEDHITYDTFGNQNNLADQPAEWVEAMMATQSAEKRIKNMLEERRQEEEKREIQKQRNKSKKR